MGFAIDDYLFYFRAFDWIPYYRQVCLDEGGKYPSLSKLAAKKITVKQLTVSKPAFARRPMIRGA